MIGIPEILIILIVVIYIITQWVVYFSAIKKHKQRDDFEPVVSVIVAAKNEEEFILNCLSSLNELDYPEDKIEIIIVNDNSTDSTQEVIDNFVKDKPKFLPMKSKKSIGELKGKANAIANAMEIAKGEIIFTTDADCIIKPSWVKTLLSYYTENVAAVFGYTHQSGNKAFLEMQSADLIYLMTTSSGMMNMNRPMSCIGNNMSYRKSAYDEVGGYESIPFSVIEDYRLLKEIYKLNKYELVYPVDVNALVTTNPCFDVKTLFRQKKRWHVGGLETGTEGFSVIITGYLVNLMILLLPFFFSWISLGFVAVRLLSDFFFLKLMHNKLGLKFNFLKLMYFEIYFFIYANLTPPVVFTSRNVVWKDAKYKT